MKAPIRAVLSAALKEVATRTTEQKLSDHTCEKYFLPPPLFFLFVGAFGRKIRFRNFQISIKEIRY